MERLSSVEPRTETAAPRRRLPGGLLSGFGLGFLVAAVLMSIPDLITRDAPEAPPPPALHRSEESLGETVTVEVAQCWVGVVVARQAVSVVAEAEGQLQQVLVRVGDTVSAAQRLAVLDTSALDHQLAIERSALERAEADRQRQSLDVARAQSEHRRRQMLTDVLSREELESSGFAQQRSAADLAAAEAETDRGRARVRQLEASLRRAEIRAPFAGTIAHRYLDAGAVVRPGTPVTRLISAENLVRFAVPTHLVDAMRAGVEVRLELEASGATRSAVIEGQAPEIDSASQMVFVEAGLDASREQIEPLSAGAVVRVSTPGTVGSCVGRVEVSL